MKMREFRRLQDNGKYRIWQIETKKDKLIIAHGWADGKMQSTVRKGESKNTGRANATTAEQDAEREAEREIELKTRDEGYREVDPATGVFLKGASKRTISFEQPPKNFRVYKPQHNMSKGLESKLESGKAIAIRKYNGNGCVVCVNKKYQTNFFTLKMAPSQKNEDPSEFPFRMRYPGLYEVFNKSSISPESMLLGELSPLHRDEDGFIIDDLDFVNGIRGSKTPEALEKQEKNGWLGLCLWDWAYHQGECLLESMPFKARFGMLRTLVQSDNSGLLMFPETAYLAEPGLIVVESMHGDFHVKVPKGGSVRKVLTDLCRDRGWEGFVIIDPDATYEGKASGFTGSEPRPGACAKLKPDLEGDFIARWDPDNGIGTRGRGKKSVGVGAVFLYLWDPDTEEEVYISKCGGGLDEEDVLRFADPSLYPMVWHVEFTSWTKNGSLQFPEFVEERDDKDPIECLISQRPE